MTIQQQIDHHNDLLAQSETWLKTHREVTRNLVKYESELTAMLHNVRCLQLLGSQTSSERNK